MSRPLTDEEKAELGLGPTVAAKGKRELTPDERAELGMPPVQARPPAAVGPHQTDNEVVDNHEQFPVADALEAGMSGASKGITFGLVDELGGAGQTLVDKLSGSDKNWGDLYRANRDGLRDYDAGLAKQSPVAHGLGEVGGAFLAPVPGTGDLKGLSAAAKVGRYALQGTGIGAAYGAGKSNADLTKGQVAQFAEDTGTGAGIGGLTGAAGGLLSQWLSKLGLSAGEKAKIARELAGTQAQKKVDEAIASANGKYGSAVQSGSRDLEVLQREADALPEGTTKEQIKAFLNSPEALQLREMVAGNKLKLAPGRVGEAANLQAQAEALKASRATDIAAKTADQLDNPVSKEILPRAATLGHRALGVVLPLAGMAVGHKLGIDPLSSGVAGGMAGITSQLFGGRNGIIVRNALRSPGVQNALYGTIEKALAEDPALAEKVGGTGKEGVTKVLQMFAAPAAKSGGTGDDALLELIRKVAGRKNDDTTEMQAHRDPSKTARDVAGESRAPDMTGQFNTKLSPSEEAQFQAWAKQRSQQEGRDITKDLFDYDLRGAWKANAKAADNGHLPDTFKKPNHPTFSDQSQYNGAAGHGGTWKEAPNGRWVFVASPTNLKNMGEVALREYFRRREPDADLQVAR